MNYWWPGAELNGNEADFSLIIALQASAPCGLIRMCCEVGPTLLEPGGSWTACVSALQRPRCIISAPDFTKWWNVCRAWFWLRGDNRSLLSHLDSLSCQIVRILDLWERERQFCLAAVSNFCEFAIWWLRAWMARVACHRQFSIGGPQNPCVADPCLRWTVRPGTPDSPPAASTAARLHCSAIATAPTLLSAACFSPRPVHSCLRASPSCHRNQCWWQLGHRPSQPSFRPRPARLPRRRAESVRRNAPEVASCRCGAVSGRRR